MSYGCTHMDTIRDVTPSAKGCEECLRIGSEWVHLRLCRECGHVGCCDDSPYRHATAHFHATQHPIIEGYDPPEGWAGVPWTRPWWICRTRRRRSGRSRSMFEGGDRFGSDASREYLAATIPR
ncbi:UBP-type zinc finger domain-containing protein [Sphingomonas faeni]|uniref:UBP-type zinc finger domain-containing protein n=1 Tax=Sphingomonas faeni TaxID=185950 RepID=UPI00278BA67C|nr:UBP-type zinc finger domain-containing protein [Sphingomonas faeni]MDQ0837435.1 hypothetical protein [Sphingomonas faeni]